MGKFSDETVQSLQRRVDAASADPEHGLPGTVVVVVDRDGKELFAHAGGTRGYGSPEPMTLDNVFWIASCTKMIVGMACMQLVEKRLLSLDDSQQVEQLCPELKEVKVLQDDGNLVEKKRGITLRMLLSHTAGFGYSFFNAKLRDYRPPIGYDEFSGHIYDMRQPLMNQPGERWEYGINSDWAGVLIERVTGLTLDGYLRRHIFEPLGLDNISMVPNASMKAKLVYMNQRLPQGQLSRRDHPVRRPLVVDSAEEVFNSGGGGCFAKPQEFCQILATLLNDGTSPITGQQLLRKETVDEMFENQIREFPTFASQGMAAAKPDITYVIPHLYPSETPQGWGLTFMITGGATGRSNSTGHWAGLPNLWWWCDREKGVAGLVCCQLLPFGDPQVLGLWLDVETAVYKSLA